MFFHFQVLTMLHFKTSCFFGCLLVFRSFLERRIPKLWPSQADLSGQIITSSLIRFEAGSPLMKVPYFGMLRSRLVNSNSSRSIQTHLDSRKHQGWFPPKKNNKTFQERCSWTSSSKRAAFLDLFVIPLERIKDMNPFCDQPAGESQSNLFSGGMTLLAVLLSNTHHVLNIPSNQISKVDGCPFWNVYL